MAEFLSHMRSLIKDNETIRFVHGSLLISASGVRASIAAPKSAKAASDVGLRSFGFSPSLSVLIFGRISAYPEYRFLIVILVFTKTISKAARATFAERDKASTPRPFSLSSARSPHR